MSPLWKKWDIHTYIIEPRIATGVGRTPPAFNTNSSTVGLGWGCSLHPPSMMIVNHHHHDGAAGGTAFKIGDIARARTQGRFFGCEMENTPQRMNDAKQAGWIQRCWGAVQIHVCRSSLLCGVAESTRRRFHSTRRLPTTDNAVDGSLRSPTQRRYVWGHTEMDRQKVGSNGQASFCSVLVNVPSPTSFWNCSAAAPTATTITSKNHLQHKSFVTTSFSPSTGYLTWHF
mmetsp:Transcript_16931/g.36948  ORF Transcript_16931/g.36948 Transcript_16931/m.36948 type:complete len:229 (-) Transcript_16931:36-722(-)